jgi:hypothetical protein
MINAKLKVVGESVNGALDAMHCEGDAELSTPESDTQRRMEEFFAPSQPAPASANSTVVHDVLSATSPPAKRLQAATVNVGDSGSDSDDVFAMGEFAYCPHCRANMPFEVLRPHIEAVGLS